MKNVVILIFASLLLVACGQEEPVEQTQMPMGEQPMGQQQMPPGHPGMGTAPATTSLEYELPEGWVQTQPSSPMRLDQATIPGPAGEGELAVFFFGPGGGGGTEANLQRWINQMSTDQEPTRESFEANGLQITWIDATGTVNPSTTGMGPAEPQPNSRMFAAVVEGEGGPWFFKATGPAETMSQARDQFVSMLQNLSVANASPSA